MVKRLLHVAVVSAVCVCGGCSSCYIVLCDVWSGVGLALCGSQCCVSVCVWHGVSAFTMASYMLCNN